MVARFEGKKRWAEHGCLLHFLWVQVTGQGTARVVDRGYSVGLLNLHAGCLVF